MVKMPKLKTPHSIAAPALRRSGRCARTIAIVDCARAGCGPHHTQFECAGVENLAPNTRAAAATAPPSSTANRSRLIDPRITGLRQMNRRPCHTSPNVAGDVWTRWGFDAE